MRVAVTHLGTVHATTIVVVVVKTVFVGIQHFVRHEGLVGGVCVSHVGGHGQRRDVHLGVDPVGLTLRIVVVKQVGLAKLTPILETICESTMYSPDCAEATPAEKIANAATATAVLMFKRMTFVLP